jgi:hypothetical protein
MGRIRELGNKDFKDANYFRICIELVDSAPKIGGNGALIYLPQRGLASIGGALELKSIDHYGSKPRDRILKRSQMSSIPAQHTALSHLIGPLAINSQLGRYIS